MSDAYLNFANSAFGARLAGMLGLPRPVPLERFEAGQPVVAGDVLVGAGGLMATAQLAPVRSFGGMVCWKVSRIQAMIWALVLTSGAGMSCCGPISTPISLV